MSLMHGTSPHPHDGTRNRMRTEGIQGNTYISREQFSLKHGWLTVANAPCQSPKCLARVRLAVFFFPCAAVSLAACLLPLSFRFLLLPVHVVARNLKLASSSADALDLKHLWDQRRTIWGIIGGHIGWKAGAHARWISILSFHEQMTHWHGRRDNCTSLLSHTGFGRLTFGDAEWQLRCTRSPPLVRPAFQSHSRNHVHPCHSHDLLRLASDLGR